LAGFPALAQTPSPVRWPSRPVTVIVPFPVGGAGDGALRVLAEVIGPRLTQSLVIENRPGAGGLVGNSYVALNGTDHTLLMGSSSITILSALRKALPYDLKRDLQPVGMISTQPMVFVVGATSPLKSLDDMLSAGRAGGISVGTSGVGSLAHLTTEFVNHRLGTRFLPVPYKGGSALVSDVVSGTVSMAVVTLPVAIPLIQNGRMRALALTSPHPATALPGVPVLSSKDSDLVIMGWAGLFASKSVPAAGVQRVEQLLRQALAEPGVEERLAALGVHAEPSTAAELNDLVNREVERWTMVGRESNIKLE